MRKTCAQCNGKRCKGREDPSDNQFYCSACWREYENKKADEGRIAEKSESSAAVPPPVAEVRTEAARRVAMPGPSLGDAVLSLRSQTDSSSTTGPAPSVAASAQAAVRLDLEKREQGIKNAEEDLVGAKEAARQKQEEMKIKEAELDKPPTSLTSKITDAQVLILEMSVALEAQKRKEREAADVVRAAEGVLTAIKGDPSCAKADLRNAKEDLDRAETRLRDAKADLRDAKADLDRAKADLRDAKADLDRAKADLRDAKADLNCWKADVNTQLDRLRGTFTELRDAVTKAASSVEEKRMQLWKVIDGYAEDRTSRTPTSEALYRGEIRLYFDSVACVVCGKNQEAPHPKGGQQQEQAPEPRTTQQKLPNIISRAHIFSDHTSKMMSPGSLNFIPLCGSKHMTNTCHDLFDTCKLVFVSLDKDVSPTENNSNDRGGMWCSSKWVVLYGVDDPKGVGYREIEIRSSKPISRRLMHYRTFWALEKQFSVPILANWETYTKSSEAQLRATVKEWMSQTQTPPRDTPSARPSTQA
jgi:hypothetical protein